jgi:membrane protease YdiL (CAAX protease family)
VNTHLGPPTREFDASEFLLVVALAFGLSILGSIAAALSYTGRVIAFGDAELAATLAYECFAAAAIGLALRSRGWRWSDLAIHSSKGATILGIILALFVFVVWYLFESLVGKVPAESTASLPMVAIVSIANPFFEELLVLGYVVQSLRKRFGLVTAMNVSLAIRLAYHLYQGPLAVIPIAFFGVVMTLVYVRMGRLWPAIVAHGILDFVGLSGWFD